MPPSGITFHSQSQFFLLVSVQMSLFKASMEIAQEYARLCGYVPAITLQIFLWFPLFNSPTLWYDTPQTLFCVQY
jgi:hypothetical protein